MDCEWFNRTWYHLLQCPCLIKELRANVWWEGKKENPDHCFIIIKLQETVDKSSYADATVAVVCN